LPPSGDRRGQFVALPLPEGPDRVPCDAQAPRVLVQHRSVVVVGLVAGSMSLATVRFAPARARARCCGLVMRNSAKSRCGRSWRRCGGACPVRGALCFVEGDLPLLRILSIDGVALLRRRSLVKRVNADERLAVEDIVAVVEAPARRFPTA